VRAPLTTVASRQTLPPHIDPSTSNLKKAIVLALGVLALSPILAAAQRRIHGFIDPMPTAKLKQLFPRAAAFTPRDKDPLRFTAYAVDPPPPGATPLGYAFWTVDLVPELLGYHGHIHMLIGMDTTGTLTGVITDLNTEPYGDISVNRPEFAAQFTGKNIRDPFVAGRDVDAVSRATISVRAAALTIRDSARAVARAVLKPD
jgi:transcriptional regulator of nitric oxide reductase